jgi:hypothetical protein
MPVETLGELVLDWAEARLANNKMGMAKICMSFVCF